jgi:hypothetical protein
LHQSSKKSLRSNKPVKIRGFPTVFLLVDGRIQIRIMEGQKLTNLMDLDPAPDPDLKHCCKVCTVFKFFFIYKFQVSVTCSKGGQRNRRCCFAGAEYRQYIIPSSSGIVQYIQNFGSLQNIMPLTFIYEKITKFPFKQRKYIKLWHKAIKQIWSA